MKPGKSNGKIWIASLCASSAVLLTGCTSQSTGNEGTAPEAENSTDEPADVDIDVPGLNLEITKEKDSASIDIDVPDEKKSDAVDIDVNSPE